METSGDLSSFAQKLLVSCGIISSLLYLGTDWLAGRLLKGYSFTAQSISELSAAGSPTRSLVVSLTFVAGLLLIAFGIGVWKVTGQTLLPRIVSGLLIGNVLVGLIAIIFFPTRFGERPIFGSIGVVLMFFSVLFFILGMVVGAMAFSGWFRVLSIAIPSTYILLAILRFATVTTSSTGEVVSLIGAQERTMSYSFLFWVMALAIYHLLLITKGVGSANGIG